MGAGKSIKNNPELIQALNLADKDIKTIMTTAFFIFKNLRRGMQKRTSWISRHKSYYMGDKIFVGWN